MQQNNEVLDLVVVKENRIDWVDALKFIGIFFIYIAHFGESSGKLCLYAYAFHVPLFFFISGLFSLKHKEESLIIYILNKVKTILLPYLVFSILTIVVLTLQKNCIPIPIRQVFREIAFGMRNQLFASQLWFFPCLFIVEILFEILLKLLKNKYVVLTACIGIFFVAECSFDESYLVLPRLWFNIDAAFHYLLYYAIGAVSFGFLTNFYFNSKKLISKIVYIVIAMCSIFIAVIVFFEKDLWIKNIFLQVPFGKSIYSVFMALNLIFLHILVAKKITKIKLICDIGKNTLWLCGNESIVKIIVPTIISVFSLYVSIPTPLHTIIYSFILLIFAQKIVIPVQKSIIGNLFTSLHRNY